MQWEEFVNSSLEKSMVFLVEKEVGQDGEILRTESKVV